MRKIALLVAALLAASAFGRVGPVSQYGKLLAGKNSSGKGQIYGSCKGVTSGNEVSVQGMSLFWSISSDVGSPFWTSDIVSGLVQKQNIQIIRAPMGVDEDWGSGNYFTKEGYYQGLMNTVVQAAIDNDIYVIIDYHSHKASDNVDNAKKFFGYMAQKWGKKDNVIFEIFNEPTSQSWGTIKTYADAVVSTIRQYSDNLIIVGNRSWDQYPSDAIGNEVSDSKNNIAYTFHFYAGSHSTGNEGANAVRAMNSGLSVFVSEWGTVNADGDGGVSNNSSTWLSWMKDHKLSGANWAVSNKNEGASYFNGSAWNYSNSGQWVNTNVFGSLPKSYTACSGSNPASSSSVASSSSFVQPAGTTDYIDDLEDGDYFAYTGGEWYAYTDAGDNGASTISNGDGPNGGYNVVYSGSAAGNSTKFVAGVAGIKLSKGANKYDPYVALGVGLNATQTAYDLSACSEISYKYKGAAHNFKAEDTAVQDYGYHQITKAASGSWTTVTIPWDMLTQESWADDVTLSKKRIAKFTWEIKGTQPTYDYLYVDDVRCSGMAIKPVPSPASSSSVKSSSSSAPKSSSSSIASSSSVKSSSSIASSSSVKSSSSIASSSSAPRSSSSSAVSSSSSAPRSSSSIASSSSVKSSSSIASSSSAKSSSSIASSSSEKVVITGELKQTVVQGGVFLPVIFSNVKKGYRQTQNIYYLNVSHSGKVLVVDGTVPMSATVGVATENIYVDGTIYTIEITVVAAESSSSELSSSSEDIKSSSSIASSSSMVVSKDWEANAQLTNASDNGVTIGATNDWVSDRVVSKYVGDVSADELYTLSFVATLPYNTMDVGISLGDYCNETMSLSATAGDLRYSCTFTAKNDGPVVLTLTMPGSRWEQVTIANILLRNGAEPESSSSSVESSSSETPATSSSISPETSSSGVGPGTSSSEGTTFAMSPVANPLSLVVVGRTLHVSGASAIAVEIFDMKGTPIVTFGHVSGTVSLDMLRQGSFVVRLRSGSNMLIRRIVVK